MRRLAPIILLCLGFPAGAAELYARGTVAAVAAPSMRLFSGDNDRASCCDGFVNPDYASLPGCTDPDRGSGAVDDWRSRFSSARGIGAGIALGVPFGGRWAAEAEYARSAAEYDRAAPILRPDGVPYARIFGAELPIAEERIGVVATDALFANIRLRFGAPEGIQPFAGIGFGVARLGIDYRMRWVRAADPELMDSAAGLPNEAQVRRNLAGTVSRASARLSDTVPAAQLFAGAQLPLGDALSLILEARYRRFDRFLAGGRYDALRSHPSNLRRDGSEPVSYRVATEDIGGFAVGAGIVWRIRWR